jgi:starch synthase (maltosyl-transferring)
VVGGALQGQVERDLHAEATGPGDEGVEVGEGAQVGVDGVVAAVRRADRVGTAGVLGAGVEEQIDNEKYEFRPRDWSEADRFGIELLLRRLNEIRRAHPALQQLRNVRVHPTSDDQVVAFSRHLDAAHSPTDRADTVVVVVNLDPHQPREAVVRLDLTSLGLDPECTHEAYDVLSDETYRWGTEVYVRLDPSVRCAHVVRLGSA